jgi:shikimate kinase
MRRRRKKSPANPRSAPSKPRIALIGFRGVGKSAIGRRLAEIWGLPLLSLDEQIEKQAGARIEDIVHSAGWQRFRDLEYAELERAANLEKVLLDCGGGIVEEADGSRSERKLKLLRENFFCIYICVSEEKLLSRLKNLARSASRPALSAADTPESLIKVFRRREPLYLELAHTVVDISDTNVAESAFRITQMLK